MTFIRIFYSILFLINILPTVFTTKNIFTPTDVIRTIDSGVKKRPSIAPSKAPSIAPTKNIYNTDDGTAISPGIKKKKAPSKPPSKSPTIAPTKKLTKAPTKKPSKAPTKKLTKAPSIAPSKAPSIVPSKKPSKAFI